MPTLKKRNKQVRKLRVKRRQVRSKKRVMKKQRVKKPKVIKNQARNRRRARGKQRLSSQAMLFPFSKQPKMLAWQWAILLRKLARVILIILIMIERYRSDPRISSSTVENSSSNLCASL